VEPTTPSPNASLSLIGHSNQSLKLRSSMRKTCSSRKSRRKQDWLSVSRRSSV